MALQHWPTTGQPLQVLRIALYPGSAATSASCRPKRCIITGIPGRDEVTRLPRRQLARHLAFVARLEGALQVIQKGMIGRARVVLDVTHQLGRGRGIAAFGQALPPGGGAGGLCSGHRNAPVR